MVNAVPASPDVAVWPTNTVTSVKKQRTTLTGEVPPSYPGRIWMPWSKLSNLTPLRRRCSAEIRSKATLPLGAFLFTSKMQSVIKMSLANTSEAVSLLGPPILSPVPPRFVEIDSALEHTAL